MAVVTVLPGRSRPASPPAVLRVTGSASKSRRHRLDSPPRTRPPCRAPSSTSSNSLHHATRRGATLPEGTGGGTRRRRATVVLTLGRLRPLPLSTSSAPSVPGVVHRSAEALPSRGSRGRPAERQVKVEPALSTRGRVGRRPAASSSSTLTGSSSSSRARADPRRLRALGGSAAASAARGGGLPGLDADGRQIATQLFLRLVRLNAAAPTSRRLTLSR
jgi:hypothetical protein